MLANRHSRQASDVGVGSGFHGRIPAGGHVSDLVLRHSSARSPFNASSSSSIRPATPEPFGHAARSKSAPATTRCWSPFTSAWIARAGSQASMRRPPYIRLWLAAVSPPSAWPCLGVAYARRILDDAPLSSGKRADDPKRPLPLPAPSELPGRCRRDRGPAPGVRPLAHRRHLLAAERRRPSLAHSHREQVPRPPASSRRSVGRCRNPSEP